MLREKWVENLQNYQKRWIVCQSRYNETNKTMEAKITTQQGEKEQKTKQKQPDELSLTAPKKVIKQAKMQLKTQNRQLLRKHQLG